jgi:DNA end-binding protein Ku
LIPAAGAEASHHVEVTGKGLGSTAPEIEIEEFVPRSEIDPVYILRPYYLVPDGRVGQDAFALIRETMRVTGKVTIGRVMLTRKERKIAPDAHGEGMVGMLLRYSHEVRKPAQYLGNIQDTFVWKSKIAGRLLQMATTSST